MLNSTFDNERATAGVLADRFIRERNLTWEQGGDRAGENQHHEYHRQASPPASSATHMARCDRQLSPERVNQWERDFIASISAWRGALTPKQQAKLHDIGRRLRVRLAS
jgi:hypothetical protein